MKNFIIITLCLGFCLTAQRTNKPVIHAKDWVAITGKPLGATAGARIFSNGAVLIQVRSFSSLILTFFEIVQKVFQSSFTLHLVKDNS